MLNKRLYLDTEFNSFGGELISLALHDPAGGGDWYEVATIPLTPHPFVAQHVIPVLQKEPIGLEVFGRSLQLFLLPRSGWEIIADWPEDFAHLLRFLCGPNGWQLKFECRLRLIDSPPFEPTIRHNALEDAKALARAVS